MQWNESRFCRATDDGFSTKFTVFSTKDDNLSTKDNEFSTKDDDLSTKNNKFSTKDSDLSTKDNKFSTKDGDLSTKDSRFSTKDDEFSTKDDVFSTENDKNRTDSNNLMENIAGGGFSETDFFGNNNKIMYTRARIELPFSSSFTNKVPVTSKSWTSKRVFEI
jgi:hypothetical protein